MFEQLTITFEGDEEVFQGTREGKNKLRLYTPPIIVTIRTPTIASFE